MFPDITITLGQTPQIDADLCDTPELEAGIDSVVVQPVIGDATPYEGEYEILPMPEAQRLPTAKRYCTEDIRVRGIPFYEVSNTSGGTTIIIDRLEE